MLTFSFYFRLQRYLIEKTFGSTIVQEKKIISILKQSQLLAAVFTGGVGGYLFPKAHYRHVVTQKFYSSMVLVLRDTGTPEKMLSDSPLSSKG